MKTIREERLWLDDGNGKNILSGQADVVYIQGNRALCLDYKSGRAQVSPASENWQLSALAVLVWENHPELTEITVGIIAPRLTHDVRACVYDEEELKLARKEIRKLVAEVMQPGQPLTPSEEACKYCKAKIACPALKRESEIVMNLPEAKNLSLLDDEDIFAARNLTGILKKRCEEVNSEALRRAQLNPEKWKEFGFEIYDKSGKRKVSNVTLAAERMVQRGATWEQIAAASTITMKNVEVITRAATGLKGKKLTEEVAAILEGAVEKGVSKPTLKRVGMIEEDEE